MASRFLLTVFACHLCWTTAGADTPALLWQTNLNLPGHYYPSGVIQHSLDSNYVVLTYAAVNHSGDSFTGVFRLTKLDKENGSVLWAQTDSIANGRPGTHNNGVEGVIYPTSSHGFLVPGITTAPTYPYVHQNQIFCVRYDSLGQREAISYRTSPPNRQFTLSATALRPEEGIVAVGVIGVNVNPISYAMGFDQASNFSWMIQESLFPDSQECYNGEVYQSMETPSAVAWKAPGEGLMVGYLICGNQNIGHFAVPFTNGGFGAPTLLHAEFNAFSPAREAIANTMDGGYLVSLLPSMSDYYPVLYKLSGGGSIEWTRPITSYVGSIFKKIIQTPDEFLVISPYEPYLRYHGLAKIDEEGNTIWQRWFTGSASEIEMNVTDFSQCLDGGYVLSGHLALPGTPVGVARLGADSLNLRHIPFPYRFGREHAIACDLRTRRPEATLLLYYRNDGGNFQAVVMDSVGTSEFFEAVLPATFTECDSIEYFIEMEENGQVVGRSRTLENPYRIWPFWRLNNGSVDYTMQVHNWNIINVRGTVWSRPWTLQDGPLEYCLNCGAGNTNLCFPDWALFRYTFGRHQTEAAGFGEPALRLLLPELFWRVIKNCWGGSCFGFSSTSGLFFLGTVALNDSFPGVANLFLAPNNARAQNIINSRQIMQWSAVHSAYESAHFNDTPRQTLEAIRDMLSSSVPQVRTLAIGNDFRHGAMPAFYHEVLPIALRRTGTHTYIVECYDPNTPMTAVTINVDLINDESDGVFSVSAYSTVGVASPGPFYLGPSVTLSMGNPPLFFWSARTECSEPTGRMQIHAGTNFYTISGSNGSAGYGLGEGGFFHYNFIAGALPMVQPTGQAQYPSAWEVPEDDYTIAIGSLDASVNFSEARPTFLAIQTGCVWLSAERAGITPEYPTYFTDTYMIRPAEHSLEVFSPQMEEEVFALSVTERDGGGERRFAVEEIKHLPGESMRIGKHGSGYLFDNEGAVDSVKINIIAISGANTQRFEASRVHVEGNARLMVDTDWSSIPDTLPVFLDRNRNGSIDDTLRLVNETPNIPCDALPPAKAPEELVIYLQADSTIRLIWNAVTEDVSNTPILIDHYVVYGSSDGGFASPVQLAATSDTTWVDSARPASSSQYFYRVIAKRCP